MSDTIEYKGMEFLPHTGNKAVYFQLEVLSRTAITEACQQRRERDGEDANEVTKLLADLDERATGFSVTVNPDSLTVPILVDSLFAYSDGRSAEADSVEKAGMGEKNVQALRNKSKVASVIAFQFEWLFNSWKEAAIL